MFALNFTAYEHLCDLNSGTSMTDGCKKLKERKP